MVKLISNVVEDTLDDLKFNSNITFTAEESRIYFKNKSLPIILDAGDILPTKHTEDNNSHVI